MFRPLTLVAAPSALVLFSGCDDANGQDTSRTETAQPAAPLPPAVGANAHPSRSKLERFLEAPGTVVIENHHLVGRAAFRKDEGLKKSDPNAYRIEFRAVVAHDTAVPKQKVRGMRIWITTSGQPGVCYLDEEQVGELAASVDRLMAALPEWDRTNEDTQESSIGVSVGALRIGLTYAGRELPGAWIESTREPKGGTWLTREELADIKRLAQTCQQILASDDPAATARKAAKGESDDADDQ